MSSEPMDNGLLHEINKNKKRLTQQQYEKGLNYFTDVHT